MDFVANLPCVGFADGHGQRRRLRFQCSSQWLRFVRYLAPDPSHACKNSMDQVLKGCKLWEFWLLMCISWNLEHGPRAD